MARDCPLCAPFMTAEHFAEVYWAYQKNLSVDEAAERAHQLGHDEVTGAQVKKHLQYCRYVQPAPRGQLRREQAIERANALPARLQDTISLIARVPGLSGTQIAEMLYWDGRGDKAYRTAREGCYRDLRRLTFGDFAYRIALSSARATGREHLKLYFLGRDGAPFVEEHEGRPLRRSEHVTAPDQVGGDDDALRLHDGAQVVTTLNRQLLELQSGEFALSVGGLTVQARLDHRNWWGAARSRLRFDDISGGGQISPSGTAAVGIEIPERRLSLLAPFFYVYDDGIAPMTQIVDDLTTYVAAARSGVVHKRWPDLPPGFFPAVLVVCSEARRVPILQRACQQAVAAARRGDEPLPLMVISDSDTVGAHGIAGDCWMSLWDADPVATRRELLDILVRSSAALLRDAPHLGATSSLMCVADAAR